MDDRVATEDDVAELVLPQSSRRRHHPSHAKAGADFFRLPRSRRSGTDHFLERDDVGIDLTEDLDDSRAAHAAVHTAAAMNIVGCDPHFGGAPRARRGRLAHC